MKEILLVFVAVVVTDVAAAAAAAPAAAAAVVEAVVVAKQQLNSVVVAAHWIGFANAVFAVVVRAAVQLHYFGLGFEFVTERITVAVGLLLTELSAVENDNCREYLSPFKICLPSILAPFNFGPFNFCSPVFRGFAPFNFRPPPIQQISKLLPDPLRCKIRA